MGTPPLQKNGIDHKQNGEIRTLFEQISRYRSENLEQHGSIIAELKSRSAVSKVLLAILLAALSAAMTIVILGANRLDTVEDRIHEVMSRGSVEGKALDDALRNDLESVESDIKELQRYHRQRPDRE